MTVRASAGWTKTVTLRVTARRRGGVGHNRDSARDRAWRRGVAHNRDPAHATRIAGFSTLRLYCPLLNSNTPVPVASEDNPSATLPAPLGPEDTVAGGQ
jgi:hypothetical protein